MATAALYALCRNRRALVRIWPKPPRLLAPKSRTRNWLLLLFKPALQLGGHHRFDERVDTVARRPSLARRFPSACRKAPENTSSTAAGPTSAPARRSATWPAQSRPLPT